MGDMRVCKSDIVIEMDLKLALEQVNALRNTSECMLIVVVDGL